MNANNRNDSGLRHNDNAYLNQHDNYLNCCVALLLTMTLVLLPSCLDLQTVQVGEYSENLPPFIDVRALYPQPENILHPIPFGKGCLGQKFLIPPVVDLNQNDTFYYLWFIDKMLVKRQNSISPQKRNTSVIELLVNEKLMQTLNKEPLDSNFFSRPHLIEFFLADRSYLFEQSATLATGAKEARAYWIVNFVKQDCI